MPVLNRKQKMYTITALIFMVGLLIFYYVIGRIQLVIDTAQYGRDRCSLDLEQAKYQLSVISEYKNRIDKILSETKKAYDSDKNRFRDILDSCVAMKQQCSFCQTQFDDLQSECNSVKKHLLNHGFKDLDQYKTTKIGG